MEKIFEALLKLVLFVGFRVPGFWVPGSWVQGFRVQGSRFRVYL